MRKRLILVALAVAIWGGGLPRANATSCWVSGDIFTFGLYVSSTGCVPACVGVSCIDANTVYNIDCRAAGDTGCTFCVKTMWEQWNPVTSKWDIPYNDSPGSGFVNCRTWDQLKHVDSYHCFNPGTSLMVVTSIYDLPCNQVTMNTPWLSYKNEGITVPPLSGQ